MAKQQQQENSSKNKFFKSKFGSLSHSKSKKASSSSSSLSPSQNKKHTSPPPQVEVKVDSPTQQGRKITQEEFEEEERKKKETLTKEEINDLNDLLSFFDDKSSRDGEQSPKKEQLPTQNYFQTRTLGRKPKRCDNEQQQEEPLTQPKQQLITKQELLERPAKGNIPRTQSQNYGRRSEGDESTTTVTVGESRRPMGRSKTLTRPARNSYARSLDRERAKKGMNITFLFFFFNLNFLTFCLRLPLFGS